MVEVTYQAEVVPGLAIQPTFEYIAHPGGNVAAPGRQPAPRDPQRQGVRRDDDGAVLADGGGCYCAGAVFSGAQRKLSARP